MAWQSVNESRQFTPGMPLVFQPGTLRKAWRIKAVVATLTGGGAQVSQSVQYSIVGTVGALWQNLFTAPSIQAGLTVVHVLGASLAKDSEAALGGLLATGTMPITPEILLGVNDSLQISLGTTAFAAGGTISLNVQYEYDDCA